MGEKNNKIPLSIICILCLTVLLVPCGIPLIANATSPTITDVGDINFSESARLVSGNNNLTTKSYITNNSFDLNTAREGYALSKNGSGTPFASFYIDALGDGGSVLKSDTQYCGFDSYGFISGSGESVYDESGNEVGKKSIVVKIKYNYSSNNNLTGTDGKKWSISDDSWKSSIYGISSVGVVGKGAVIVQKFVPTEDKASPRSQKDWQRLNEFSGDETDGLHTVNFFEEYSPSTYKDPFTIYVPQGSDLRKGIYLKITVAYELVHSETSGWWIFSSEKQTYKNVVEETTFYLCNTSAEVIFENLYFENSDQGEEKTDFNTTSAEQKGGPISSNQGAIDGFRVNTNGCNYEITYRFNDSTNALPCSDGQVFKDVGKYEFIIKTKVGVVRTKTVYVHEKTNSKNLEVYFGDGLFSSDSIRIFAPAETYPVYVKGSATLQTQDENASLTKHAPLVGRVYLLDNDWETVQRDSNGLPINGLIAEKHSDDHNWSFSNLESGMYEAVFFNNEEYFNGTSTGDTYKFVWRFTIAEEGQLPTVNEELLYQQIGFSDYESKHYVVKLPTAGSGSVLVSFTEELSAYDFACKYLVSTVLRENNTYVFDGVTYSNEKDMLVELHKKAHYMVDKRYYDATNINTYLTLEHDILVPMLGEGATEEEIKEYNAFVGILDREIDYDILVFLNEEDRENAAIGEPFLNDRIYAYIDESGNIVKKANPLYFISIADFESYSVKLYLEGTDISYDLPYGVAVEAFLASKNAPTGRYKIVESNPCGTVEYHAIYIRRGDITTTVTLQRIYNNNSLVQTLSKVNDGIRIRANNFKIVDIYNELDPYGIIKITKMGGETFIYQIDEYEDIPTIDEEGNYEITLVDRLGNTVSFFVDIYIAKKTYMFTLSDGNDVILSESAYGGKKIDLPALSSQDDKLEFYGWEDENGNVFNGMYTFNSPHNVNLRAVWHHTAVNIEIYDGNMVESYTGKVGDLQVLPKLKREGYSLYGFRHVLEDGTIRFYRAQITKIPNYENIRLDAIWIKQSDFGEELSYGSGDTVKVSLINGDRLNIIVMQKGEQIDLPKLGNENAMTFYGWIYEYRLAGIISTDVLDYNEIAEIGMSDDNAIKLTAAWIASTDKDDDILSIAGSTGNFDNFTSKGYSLSGIVTDFGVISLLSTILFALWLAFKTEISTVFAFICEWIKSKKIGNKIGAWIDNHSILCGRVYRKVLVPCVSVILALVTIYFASYDTVALAAESTVAYVSEACEKRELEKEKELRVQKVADVLDDVKSTFAVDDESLTESQEFLYSNVIVDLVSMGYHDVFTAYAVVGQNTANPDDDRKVYGIGYTSYTDAYKEDEHYVFGAGFVSLASNDSLTKKDVESGVTIFVSEEEADDFEYAEFRLTNNQTWGPLHYVAYSKYVTYQVVDYVVQYAIEEDDGCSYIESLGDVYSYDIGDYCHYTQYGEEFDLDAYGITSDMDYDQILQVFRETMETQLQNSVSVSVEKADFISIQAINDYIAHNQDESFLGVDADTLLYYEANISDTQYYIIYEDGTVGVLELPPDPERKASTWERIAWAVGTIGVAVIGVVCCVIPGIGPIIGGILISAAIDLFMQTVVSGTAAENINWISVGTSAIIGGLTGGFGSGLSAAAANVTKGAVKQMLAKLGAEVVSGLFSGAATYLIGTAARGEEITFEECLKSMAIGAATGIAIFVGGQAISAIAKKVGAKNFANFAKSPVGIVIGGSLAGLASYLTAISITGEEFSISGLLMAMGMGAATATLVVVGGKIVKTVQSAYEKRINKDDVARLKNRIHKHLPSDKNKNWSYETIDADGNYIKSSKASLLENPNQKMYIVNKDGIRIEIIDGYPQFSNVTSIKAMIDDGIVLDRQTNFDRFDEELADIWSSNPNNIPDDFKLYFERKNVDIDYLTAADIREARQGKTGLGYTWHESEDMHTGYLVKTSIHKTVAHSGGIENLMYILKQSNHGSILQKQNMYNAIANINEGG